MLLRYEGEPGKVFARDLRCRHSRTAMRGCCKSLRGIEVLLKLLLQHLQDIQPSRPLRDIDILHRLRCAGEDFSPGTVHAKSGKQINLIPCIRTAVRNAAFALL